MELVNLLREKAQGLTATVVCCRADLLTKAADEIERLRALIEPEPRKNGPPGPCPSCGRSDMYDVTMIDVGNEGGISDQIPAVYHCTNPRCPTNVRRYVHAHWTVTSGGMYPCCGLDPATTEGALSTTDPAAVTCPGFRSKITYNPEEGTDMDSHYELVFKDGKRRVLDGVGTREAAKATAKSVSDITEQKVELVKVEPIDVNEPARTRGTTASES